MSAVESKRKPLGRTKLTPGLKVRSARLPEWGLAQFPGGVDALHEACGRVMEESGLVKGIQRLERDLRRPACHTAVRYGIQTNDGYNWTHAFQYQLSCGAHVIILIPRWEEELQRHIAVHYYRGAASNAVEREVSELMGELLHVIGS